MMQQFQAEIERLRAEITEQRAALCLAHDKQTASLRAINAELLAALQRIAGLPGRDCSNIARAAIAKADAKPND